MSYVNKVKKDENRYGIQDIRIPDINTLTDKGKVISVDQNGNYTLSDANSSISFDNTPLQGSEKPVKSGGIYNALSGKQDALEFDSTPTQLSNNPVTSDGIYKAVSDKQDKLIPGENIANLTINGVPYSLLDYSNIPIETGEGGGGSTVTGNGIKSLSMEPFNFNPYLLKSGVYNSLYSESKKIPLSVGDDNLDTLYFNIDSDVNFDKLSFRNLGGLLPIGGDFSWAGITPLVRFTSQGNYEWIEVMYITAIESGTELFDGELLFTDDKLYEYDEEQEDWIEKNYVTSRPATPTPYQYWKDDYDLYIYTDVVRNLLAIKMTGWNECEYTILPNNNNELSKQYLIKGAQIKTYDISGNWINIDNAVIKQETSDFNVGDTRAYYHSSSNNTKKYSIDAYLGQWNGFYLAPSFTLPDVPYDEQLCALSVLKRYNGSTWDIVTCSDHWEPDIWLDTANQLVKLREGPTTYSNYPYTTTQPSNPSDGDYWYDEPNDALYQYDSSYPRWDQIIFTTTQPAEYELDGYTLREFVDRVSFWQSVDYFFEEPSSIESGEEPLWLDMSLKQYNQNDDVWEDTTFTFNNPSIITVGAYKFDTSIKYWKHYSSSDNCQWIYLVREKGENSLIEQPIVPTPTIGTFMFFNNRLYEYDENSNWKERDYKINNPGTNPSWPDAADLYFDYNNKKLYSFHWNSSARRYMRQEETYINQGYCYYIDIDLNNISISTEEISHSLNGSSEIIVDNIPYSTTEPSNRSRLWWDVDDKKLKSYMKMEIMLVSPMDMFEKNNSYRNLEFDNLMDVLIYGTPLNIMGYQMFYGWDKDKFSLNSDKLNIDAVTTNYKFTVNKVYDTYTVPNSVFEYYWPECYMQTNHIMAIDMEHDFSIYGINDMLIAQLIMALNTLVPNIHEYSIQNNDWFTIEDILDPNKPESIYNYYCNFESGDSYSPFNYITFAPLYLKGNETSTLDSKTYVRIVKNSNSNFKEEALNNISIIDTVNVQDGLLYSDHEYTLLVIGTYNKPINTINLSIEIVDRDAEFSPQDLEINPFIH